MKIQIKAIYHNVVLKQNNIYVQIQFIQVE